MPTTGAADDPPPRSPTPARPMTPPKRCTARVTWGALFPGGPRPEGCPIWHQCTKGGEHKRHRTAWQGKEFAWDRAQGGRRTAGPGKKVGRPRKAPAELAGVRIVAHATQAEAGEIDAVRGKVTAGRWLLEAGLRAARRGK